MPATPRRSTQPALWPPCPPALHIADPRPANRNFQFFHPWEGEAPAEPQTQPTAARPAVSASAFPILPAHHRTLPAAHRHPEPPGETTATEPLNWLREQPCDSWAIGNLGSSSRGIQPTPRGCGVGEGFTQSHRALGRRLPACRNRWARLFVKQVTFSAGVIITPFVCPRFVRLGVWEFRFSAGRSCRRWLALATSGDGQGRNKEQENHETDTQSTFPDRQFSEASSGSILSGDSGHTGD